MVLRHLLSHPCSEADRRSPTARNRPANSSPVSSAPASTDIKGVRSNCKPVSSPVGAKRCSTIILLYVRNLWTVKEVPRIEGVVADIFDTNPPSALLVVSTYGAPPPVGTTCVMKETCREKFKVTTSAKGRDHVSLSVLIHPTPGRVRIIFGHRSRKFACVRAKV